MSTGAPGDPGLFVRRSGAAGAAAGTLVWVHGLGESGLCFEGLLAHPGLAAWRQLCVDLPGYGKSPWRADRPLTLGEQADVVGRVLEAEIRAGAGPLVLVGHSMGGVIGTMVCEAHGDRLAGFIDVEGNISAPDCSFSGVAAAAAEDEMAAAWRRLLDRIHRGGVDDRALRGYHASLMLCDRRAFFANSRELVQLSATHELAPRLGALGLPTGYIHGSPHGTGPRSREMLAAAGVPCLAVEGAGHWPFIDQPDAFVARARELLEAL